MKYFVKFELLSAITLLLAAASAPAQIPFDQVCKAANNHTLVIKTDTSERVAGKCLSTEGNVLNLQTQRGLVHLTRGQIRKAWIRRTNGHLQEELSTLATIAVSSFSGEADIPRLLMFAPLLLVREAIVLPTLALGDAVSVVAGSRKVNMNP